jgi:hypothetical protein
MHRTKSSDGYRSGKRFNLVLRWIDNPAAADAESAGRGKDERSTKPGTHFAILHEPLTTKSLDFFSAVFAVSAFSVICSHALYADGHGPAEAGRYVPRRVLARANAVIGGRRRLEQPKAGDHQTISLAGQRRRQYRVTLRIPSQLLSKANQVLPLERRTSAFDFHDLGKS